MTKKAVIIGAGYGGLALANLLAKAGYDVAVGFKWSSKMALPLILARRGI